MTTSKQAISVEHLEKLMGRPLTIKERRRVAKQPITWEQLNRAVSKQGRDEVRRQHYKKPNGKCACSGLVWFSDEHLIKVTRENIGGYFGNDAE